MALLNEKDIDAYSAATLPDAPPLPVASSDGKEPMAPAADPNNGAIGDLIQGEAELKNQIFNVRSEIARTSAAARKTTILSSILVVLVMLVVQAAAWFQKLAPDSFHGEASGSTQASTLQELQQAIQANGKALTSLSGGLEAVGTRLKHLDEGLTRLSATQAAAVSPPGRMDCAKLPEGIRLETIDLSVQFELGSTKVVPNSKPILDSVAKILALAPNRCILVEGYSDSSGKEDKNLALSRGRAKVVIDYIIEQGSIDRSFLALAGKGSSSSASDLNPSDPKNRRVIFKVVAE